MENPPKEKKIEKNKNKIWKSFKKPWGIIKKKPMSFF